MEAKNQSFTADHTINRPMFKDLVQSWSLLKKVLVGLSAGIFIGFTLLGPSAIAISLGEKWGTTEFEAIFRLVAQASIGFVVPCFLLVFILSIQRLFQFEYSFRETAKFAFDYSPKCSSKKYWVAWRHARAIYICTGAMYYVTYVSWFLLPIYEYISTYPDINYDKLHLFFGDQDFGFYRAKYFWYMHAIYFCSAFCVTTVTLHSYTLSPIFCTLIGGQIQILKESLKRIGVLEEQEDGRQLIKASLHRSVLLHLHMRKERDCATLYPHNLKKKTLSLFWELILVGKRQDREKVKSGAGELSSAGVDERMLTLRNCTIHHQQILRLIQQIKQLITPFLFLKALSTTLSIVHVAVIMASGSTHMPKALLVPTGGALFINLSVGVWYVTKLRDEIFSISDAAYPLLRHKNIPRKHLFTIITRSLLPVKFPCYLTSSLCFKDLYRLLDLSWNYFTITELMAKEHPEGSRTGHLP